MEKRVPAAEVSKNPKDEDDDQLTVEVRYRGMEETFSGSVDSVWVALNKFLNELLPSFDIARKLTLSVDVQKLVKDCESIIALTKEGPCLLVPRNKLTDNETLSLLLLAAYLAHRLDNAETDSVSKDDLQNKLGKDAKITSTRLGELIKAQVAARTTDDKYAITTFGLNQIQKDVIPRIRAKM